MSMAKLVVYHGDQAAQTVNAAEKWALRAPNSTISAHLAYTQLQSRLCQQIVSVVEELVVRMVVPWIIAFINLNF